MKLIRKFQNQKNLFSTEMHRNNFFFKKGGGLDGQTGRGDTLCETEVASLRLRLVL